MNTSFLFVTIGNFINTSEGAVGRRVIEQVTKINISKDVTILYVIFNEALVASLKFYTYRDVPKN